MAGRRVYLRAWRGAVPLIALAGVFVVFLLHEYHVSRRIEPPTADCTVVELARKVSPPQRVAVVTQNGLERLVWIGHVPALTIRSGPPCYVFDERGRLIDWCSETGEGWRSENLVAAAFEARPMSLEDALRWSAKEGAKEPGVAADRPAHEGGRSFSNH